MAEQLTTEILEQIADAAYAVDFSALDELGFTWFNRYVLGGQVEINIQGNAPDTGAIPDELANWRSHEAMQAKFNTYGTKRDGTIVQVTIVEIKQEQKETDAV